MESSSGLFWNPHPDNFGIAIRFPVESASGLAWNIHLKLLNGDTKLTRQEVARDLNITVSELDNACEKMQMPKFLNELTKSTKIPEWIKEGLSRFDDKEPDKIGNNFEVTRDRIRQIKTKIIKKLNQPESDDDPPDDVA